MADKCALVVDDSRLARSLLSNMLKRYELHVDLAETAEEALDFLRHQRPDVIFMDHMMPGMDGLAAVKIIKDDPKTATIPIIMYTSKEGEVYVGQARALGAIGILPKEVEASELYQVLRNLNIVAERRSEPKPTLKSAWFDSAYEPSNRAADKAKSSATPVRAEIDITRLRLMFETQQVRLQEAVQKIVKTAVKDVVEQQAAATADRTATDSRVSSGGRWRLGPLGITIIAASLLLPTYLLYGLYSETRTKLNESRGIVAELKRELQDEQTRDDDKITSGQVQDPIRGAQRLNELQLLETVEWTLNLKNRFAYDQIPFDDEQLRTIQGLIAHLATSGFEGEVRLTPHFSRFCLTRNSVGQWALAPNDLPIEACELLGHPTQESTGSADLQSLAFGSFLASSPVLNEGKIRIDIAMPERTDSPAFAEETRTARNAGEWNQIAQRNNRVRVELVPRDQ